MTDIKAERVYLNKNLSKTGRNLLYLARRFQKEKGWKYAWSSSGTILLRKNEKLKVNVINSVELLKNYRAIINLFIYLLNILEIYYFFIIYLQFEFFKT